MFLYEITFTAKKSTGMVDCSILVFPPLVSHKTSQIDDDVLKASIFKKGFF